MTSTTPLHSMTHFTKLTLLCAFVAGCASSLPPPRLVTIHATFDEAEAARLLEPGKNTLLANAFMRQRGGGVVTCAGSSAVLFPATAYAAERIGHIYGPRAAQGTGFSAGYSLMFAPDERAYYRHQRKTTCDAQGNFRFNDVADGDFYVMTTVRWTAGDRDQGGSLIHRVSLHDGSTVNLVIAP